MGGWVGGCTEFVSLRERIISVSAISHGNRSGAGWIRGGGEEEMDRGRLGFERWEWDGTSIRWEMMLWGKKKFDMKRRRGGCWQEWRVDTWRQAGWWYLQPSDGPDVSPISARSKCNCRMMMARISPSHWGRTTPDLCNKPCSFGVLPLRRCRQRLE